MSTHAAPPRNDFFAAFDALAQAVRRARGTGGRAAVDSGLTLSQYALLEGLAGHREARVQELADRAGITPSTATRILDALERRRVVRRTRSREDRRAVAVSLTALGERLLDNQRGWMRDREAAFYESLPEVEQELAPDLLLRLAALIDELAVGPGDEIAAPVPPLRLAALIDELAGARGLDRVRKNKHSDHTVVTTFVGATHWIPGP